MSLPEMVPDDVEQPDETIEVGKLRIIPHEFEATYDGGQLRLTHKEFQLLTLFARKPGRVLNREKIAEEVWGGDAPGRTIDIHVSRLRRHLPHGAITTIIRVGYRLTL